MYNKEIRIPTELYYLHNNKLLQFLDVDSIRTPKIVIWLDSIGCSPCKMHSLFYREEDYHFLKDSIGIDIKYWVIVSPKKGELTNILSYIWESNFDIPILIDIQSNFSALNIFIPQDEVAHSFLLDSNNIIKTIGPPFYNDEMLNLYLRTIGELQSIQKS